MRFLLIINNLEAESNGDDYNFDDVKDEVEELLRSGYYEVEDMEEMEE